MRRFLTPAALAICLVIPGLFATGCAIDPVAAKAPREEKEAPTGSRLPR